MSRLFCAGVVEKDPDPSKNVVRSRQEGNHGEDVKECYYYLDATPTHFLPKGPSINITRVIPTANLVGQNIWRDKRLGEIELADMGLFRTTLTSM